VSMILPSHPFLLTVAVHSLSILGAFMKFFFFFFFFGNGRGRTNREKTNALTSTLRPNIKKMLLVLSIIVSSRVLPFCPSPLIDPRDGW